MRILRMSAENVLKLKCVEITPDGNVVVISGKNAQGKSSVLNAIWLALGGGEASRAISKPVRDGEAEAFVELDLGDFTVRREWSGEKTTLKVMNNAGAKYPSPQAMLDALVGKLSFDPVAFANYEDRKQVETLRELTGLDFSAFDAEAKEVYDERTATNRLLKDAEAQLKTITPPKATGPVELVKIEDLQQKLVEAKRVEIAVNAKQTEQHSVAAEHARLDDRCEYLAEEIVRLHAELTQTGKIMADLAVKADMLEEELNEMVVPDTDAIVQEIAGLADQNNRIREREQYTKLKARHDALAEDSAKAGMRLDEIKRLKEEAIAGAAMPIDGLAFEGDVVTYNGIPFKQCSAAEQLRVSLAMAAALNPELKVIRIMDGSLLDKANFAVITKMAEEKDLQVWLELIAEGPGTGIYLEEGEVVEIGRQS